MAKKKLSAENLMSENIISAATGAAPTPAAEDQAPPAIPAPIKKNRKKTTPGPGRPSIGRTSVLSLKLQPELKDYLRLRSFEETSSNEKVSMADIVEGLIIRDMKNYYRNKGKAEK